MTLPAGPDRSHEVVVGRDILGRAVAALLDDPPGRIMAVVTDDTVRDLHARAFAARCGEAGIPSRLVSVPPGESSKSFAVLERTLEGLRGAGLGRGDFVAAFGGGVVGDLAGLAAGLYMRGVPCVGFPTTLLAQVDASVGGKVAVNLGGAKNMAGLFVQPRSVWCDVALVSTLPEAVYRDGLAEVVKYGMAADAGLFAFLEANAASLAARAPAVLETVVARCVAIKARIVAADEREAGERMLLNYGHTFGHAFETLSDFGLSHGQAVAAGMAVAGRLAVALGMCPAGDVARQDALLAALGLGMAEPGFPAREMLAVMAGDKKAAGGRIRFVLPRSTGRAVVAADVPEAVLLRILDQGRPPA